MKKIILLNASPRKNGNTALLLQAAQQGAQEAGAETELINLFDLKFTGCRRLRTGPLSDPVNCLRCLYPIPRRVRERERRSRFGRCSRAFATVACASRRRDTPTAWRGRPMGGGRDRSARPAAPRRGGVNP